MEENLLVAFPSSDRKSGLFSPVRPESLNIQFRHDPAVFKQRRFRQYHSVLRNDVMAAKDQIRTGLAFSRTGVDITAEQAGRLAGDQISAVTVFPGGLVAGREVDDHRRSCHGMGNTGRHRRPEIFAKLRCHRKPPYLRAGKEYLTSEGNPLPIHCHPGHFFLSRRKVSLLIKFRVSRQKALRHQSQQLSVRNNRRHIIKLSVLFPRKPHKD